MYRNHKINIKKVLSILFVFLFTVSLCQAEENQCFYSYPMHGSNSTNTFLVFAAASCGLAKDDVPKIINYINNHPDITGIYLGDSAPNGNMFGDMGVIALSRNLPSIKYMSIQGGSGMTALGLKVLLKNSNLINIDFFYNEELYEKLPGTNDMIAALARNSTLLNLSLGYVDFSQVDFSPIEKNTTLTGLKLRHDNLADAHAIAISRMSGIKSLILWDNQIGDEGAKALARNMTLEHLELSNNLIGDAGALAFIDNTSLKHLDLSNNPITEATKQKLRENCKIPILYL